jgi:NADH-quinone oxidoreductase subunit C
LSSADTDTDPDSETEAAAAPDAPEVEVEVDEHRASQLAVFRRELGDAVVGSHVVPGDELWVRVSADAWRAAGLVARDKLRCSYFCFVSAIDWLPSPFGRYERAVIDEPLDLTAGRDAPLATGYAGGDTRFQVLARVNDVQQRSAVLLKVDVPDDTMTVDSWVPVYAGADWHERETWEMFGITFAGHPGLRHIYLPTEFEGFPLRKDFPLLARIVKPWPGIVDVEPMPGEPDSDDAEGDANAAVTEGGDEVAPA